MELVGRGTLVPESVRGEFAKSVATPQKGLSYGLGVFLADNTVTGRAGKGVGHGGDIFGYHSWVMYFPEKETTIVGAVATDTLSGNDVLAAALEVVFP
jgi:hypothetical protein